MSFFSARCPCCNATNWHVIGRQGSEYDKWSDCSHFQGFSKADKAFYFSDGSIVNAETPDRDRSKESVDR